MDENLTLEEIINHLKERGVKEFHYFHMDDDCGWHWDIYSNDPHKWFSIPKPWTLTVHWLGNKGYQKTNPNRWLRNKWFVGFPWFFMVDSWMFTYYKGAEKMGCQCTDKSDLIAGIRAAADGYECDVADSDCDKCFAKNCEVRDEKENEA